VRARLAARITLLGTALGAWGVLTAAPVEVQADGDSAPAIVAVVSLTNLERTRAGVAPLVENPALDAAAQSYAQVLAATSCFSHSCGPIPAVEVRIERAGYGSWSALAENIAAGYPTPERVVAGWMGSADHRANMLSGDLTEIGVGVVFGAGRLGGYWVQDFGTHRPDPEESASAP
jgi:uncharacterized protein YkwD